MKKLRAIMEYFLGKDQGWNTPKWVRLMFGPVYQGRETWKVGPFFVRIENGLVGDTFYMSLRNGGKVKLVKNFKVKSLTRK